MPGALLRSGEAREFQALGVDGQPVYSAALPLREAIRLKLGADAANCLAQVQPSESGERFDWYAPLEGDVIPWVSATDEERRNAYARLEVLQRDLLATAERMEQDAGNREKQVFARLLRQAVQFPGSEHVYLVDGKPVVTFWGFAAQGNDTPDPLLHLRPPPPSPPAPSPAPAPAPVGHGGQGAPVQGSAPLREKSRWRWLWWLLPLLLLLLLALFLLRFCAPQIPLPFGLDGLDWPGLPAEVVDENISSKDSNSWSGNRDGNISSKDSNSWSGNRDGNISNKETNTWNGSRDGNISNKETDTSDGNRDEDISDEETDTSDGNRDEDISDGETDTSNANQDEDIAEEAPSATQPPALEGPADESMPENATDQPIEAPPELPAEQAPGQPLRIPEQARKTGSTDFLDGKWKAGGGIQDMQTGQPLRLDYEFNKGKGEVHIKREDGVQCRGPVRAALQDGKLAIHARGKASCSDGSSYDLPQVQCETDDSSGADCQGSYSDREQNFPMSMRKNENGK